MVEETGSKVDSFPRQFEEIMSQVLKVGGNAKGVGAEMMMRDIEGLKLNNEVVALNRYQVGRKVLGRISVGPTWVHMQLTLPPSH